MHHDMVLKGATLHRCIDSYSHLLLGWVRSQAGITSFTQPNSKLKHSITRLRPAKCLLSACPARDSSQHDYLAASPVLLHALMRLDDLVHPEDLAHMYMEAAILDLHAAELLSHMQV